MFENLVVEIEVCSGILFDLGGNDVYSDGIYFVFMVILFVGDLFMLDLFYVDIEINYDNLYIYDGLNEMLLFIVIIIGYFGIMIY